MIDERPAACGMPSNAWNGVPAITGIRMEFGSRGIPPSATCYATRGIRSKRNPASGKPPRVPPLPVGGTARGPRRLGCMAGTPQAPVNDTRCARGALHARAGYAPHSKAEADALARIMQDHAALR